MLLEKYSFRIFYGSGSRLGAKLSSVIKNRNSCWPPAWSEDLVCILSVLPEVDVGESDMPIWNILKKGIYSCSKTWEAIRCRLPKVNCCCLVWFPMAIPRHALMLWLAVKDSLSTGEKLASWGYSGAVHCWFCRIFFFFWKAEIICFFTVASVEGSGKKSRVEVSWILCL